MIEQQQEQEVPYVTLHTAIEWCFLCLIAGMVLITLMAAAISALAYALA